MSHRVLMLGSLPLSAPWNGADKLVARALIEADDRNHYTFQTGPDDRWDLRHVTAVRTPHVTAMPTTGQKLRGFAFLIRHAPAVDLVHLVASIRKPSRLGVALLRSWRRLAPTPLLHTAPSLGDGELDARYFVADLTVVVSEHSRRRLQDLGVREVVRIPPPMDRRRLERATDCAGTMLELNVGARAVLYPGHYGPDSGIEEMLQAFAALPSDLADAVLVLASRPHVGQEPAVEAARVMARAHELGLGERVRVVGNRSDILCLIQSTAVTALVPRRMASKMDLPLVLLEAQALGRPIVVADRPPMSEVLLDEGGMAVSHGNVPQLTAVLAELLRNPELRNRLGAQGQASVLRQCDPAEVASRYNQVYEAVLEARGRAITRPRPITIDRDTNGT